MPSTQQLLTQALDHHRQGRLDHAREVYRKLLQRDPTHADALHLLGLVCYQQGDASGGADYVRRAIRLNPRAPDYHSNLGQFYFSLGRLDDAIQSFEQALALEQDHPEACFNLANTWHSLGRFADAAALLEKYLCRRPADPGAHNNLGNALRALGRTADALDHYQQALRHRPDYPEAHLNLAVVLGDLGRHQEALDSAHRALRLRPAFAEAENQCGLALNGLGRPAEALAHFETALRLGPNYAEAHNNLGVALEALGRFEEARAAFGRALEAAPEFLEARGNLANLLQAEGRHDEAAVRYRELLALRPGWAPVWNNLGNALADLGRYPEALAAYQEALRLAPRYAAAATNLGNALRRQGRYQEARGWHEKALALEPGSVETLNNLGVLLADMNQPAEAMACLEKALAIQPAYADAMLSLANVCRDTARLEEAVARLRRALQLRPRHAHAWNNLGVCLVEQGLAEEAIECHRKALAIQPNYPQAESNLLLDLHYLEALPPERICEEHRNWGRRHMAAVAPRSQLPGNSPDPDRPLRVGYVSADFRRHSVASFLEPVIASHDRARFEVFCYAHAPRPDRVTARFRDLAGARWRDVAPLTNEGLADLIRDDGIDILLDLGGHTSHSRLLAFAHRPAPVQITWLGYFNTTGLEAIAYRITDPWADPPGQTDSLHVEKLVRLPGGFSCYGAPTETVPVGPLPSLGGAPFTFGSFNNQAKIGPGVVAAWAQILRGTPGSRLLLKNRALGDPAARGRLEAAFEAHGIGADRLMLAGVTAGLEEHLAVYGRIDLALDTFPFNGATTTCEALWMGAPVVALAGRAHVGRVGVSILARLGLDEFIARSPEQYIALAVSAAGRRSDLAALRAGLRERLRRSPVMDAAGFTASLEAAYRRLWRHWCAGYHNGLGVILEDAGRRDAARSSFERALDIDPDYAEAHNNRANLDQLEGRLDEAAGGYRRALELDPAYAAPRANFPRCLHEIGNRHHRQQRYDEAAGAYQEALALQPDFPEARFNLGVTRMAQNRLAEARGAYEAALRAKPDYAEAHNNLANVLLALGEPEAALEGFGRAIAARPDYLDARYNLGAALQDRDRFEEAAAVYLDLLRRQPDHGDTHNNLGGIALASNRLEEAIGHYRRALEVAPNHPEAAWNLGLAHLTRGDFEPGWEGYRKRLDQKTFPARDFAVPPWNGEPLEAKTVLLWAEQGLGDTIQFVRYAAAVRARGARVILECQPRLETLLEGAAGVDQVIAKGDPLPAFDCHAPLLELPRLLGTRLESIPAGAPYLGVPEDLRARWRSVVHQHPGRRVGLCWSANPHNVKGRKRSLPFECLAPLASLAGVTLVSLQREPPPASEPPLVVLESEQTSVLDSAAIIASLDLILSVDTMIAHLAGALARPVWTLLPHAADWRWMLDRDDSPWYPTMRLFRERRPGGWPELIERVIHQLRPLL